MNIFCKRKRISLQITTFASQVSNTFLPCHIQRTSIREKCGRRLLHLAEAREEGYKRTLVVVEIYHRLPRDVERASARALSARSREGCASVAWGPGEKKIESRRVPVVPTCSCAAEEGGQDRLITVAFCGFVARHDPRAFRGHHCSAPNRSGNSVGQSYAVGEFPSYVKHARADPRMCILWEPIIRTPAEVRSWVRHSRVITSILIYLFSLSTSGRAISKG